MIVNQPLELTNTTSQFDVSVNVYGGGYRLDKLELSVMVSQEHYYKLVLIIDQL